MNNRKRKAIKPDRNKIDKIIPGKILPLFFFAVRTLNFSFDAKLQVISFMASRPSVMAHNGLLKSLNVSQ